MKSIFRKAPAFVVSALLVSTPFAEAASGSAVLPNTRAIDRRCLNELPEILTSAVKLVGSASSEDSKTWEGINQVYKEQERFLKSVRIASNNRAPVSIAAISDHERRVSSLRSRFSVEEKQLEDASNAEDIRSDASDVFGESCDREPIRDRIYVSESCVSEIERRAIYILQQMQLSVDLSQRVSETFDDLASQLLAYASQMRIANSKNNYIKVTDIDAMREAALRTTQFTSMGNGNGFYRDQELEDLFSSECAYLSAGQLAFYRKNADQESVRFNQNGVQYEVLQAGNGSQVRFIEGARYHISVLNLDGGVKRTTTASGNPIIVESGGSHRPEDESWQAIVDVSQVRDAVDDMRVGETRRLWVFPSKLSYHLAALVEEQILSPGELFILEIAVIGREPEEYRNSQQVLDLIEFEGAGAEYLPFVGGVFERLSTGVHPKTVSQGANATVEMSAKYHGGAVVVEKTIVDDLFGDGDDRFIRLAGEMKIGEERRYLFAPIEATDILGEDADGRVLEIRIKVLDIQ